MTNDCKRFSKQTKSIKEYFLFRFEFFQFLNRIHVTRLGIQFKMNKGHPKIEKASHNCFNDYAI